MIDGDEFDLNTGTVSTLSFRPLSLAARSVADERSCLLLDPLHDETAHWLLVQGLASLPLLPGVAVSTHVQRIMEEP